MPGCLRKSLQVPARPQSPIFAHVIRGKPVVKFHWFHPDWPYLLPVVT